MVNYESLYHKLFNACTDAIHMIALGKAAEAGALLITAQQDCEDEYLDAGEETE
ncbi:MAG: hypothetical protein IJ042_05765 [Butyricicoccus sp.]|nr:hypothetical protein [Butyricicoccus sp.]